MTRSVRGRGATVVAVVLAAAWLAAAAAIHVPLVVPVLTDQTPPSGAVADFLLRGGAALTFLGAPALVAGAVGVGATRHPGVPRPRRGLARAAFLVALTGPAEAAALALLAVVLSLLS